MIKDARNKDPVQQLHWRLRASALYVSLLGLLINAGAFAGLYLLGDATPLIIAEVSAHGLILAAIGVCAYRDFHVKSVLFGGLAAIYTVFWISAFAYAWLDDSLLLAMPLILFVPLLLTIALPHRLLFAIAPIQFAAVFLYVGEYALPQLGVTWPAADQFALSLGLAGFSGAAVVAFALLAVERAQTDKNLVALIAETDRIASIDPLTELLNRRAFLQQLESQWPPRQPLAIAFIDLDHFKPLNDQYGHAMGDFVLRQVAERLSGIPSAVAVARLGGDEFAVCCACDDRRHEARSMAAEMHNRIAAEFQTEAGPISMGASVGFAVYDSEIGSLSKLLRAADAAMRRAKATRSGWAIFSQVEDSAALSSTSIEFELKSAVRSGQIRAAVQPIAQAPNLSVAEYELLARWVDSGFDEDPGPAQFVPIAEKLGLLNEILWVTLDEALSELDLANCKLAINVSPAQLLASDFFDTLLDILSRHNVKPDRITIEVTEEVVFRNLEKNVAVLERARMVGMSVALDDFGSGYSSLSMLDALPLDKLKIDRSLVRKAGSSERSANILSAAISLAQQLELIACVEGVESEEELRRVLAMGANQLQGYWVGRPRLLRDAARTPLKLVAAN